MATDQQGFVTLTGTPINRDLSRRMCSIRVNVRRAPTIEIATYWLGAAAECASLWKRVCDVPRDRDSVQILCSDVEHQWESRVSELGGDMGKLRDELIASLKDMQTYSAPPAETGAPPSASLH